jgi:predicted transcriptional regulator
MNKTFFIRLLDNDRIFIMNNDNGQTKVVADTDMLREYIQEYIDELKEREFSKNSNNQSSSKR